MGKGVMTIELNKKTAGLLTRVLDSEYRRLKLELMLTEEKIKKFENKYGMGSEVFLDKYIRGELGDDEEFMEWYGELRFLESIRKELEELKNIEERISRKLRGKG